VETEEQIKLLFESNLEGIFTAEENSKLKELRGNKEEIIGTKEAKWR
jgi:hypothetical protein